MQCVCKLLFFYYVEVHVGVGVFAVDGYFEVEVFALFHFHTVRLGNRSDNVSALYAVADFKSRLGVDILISRGHTVGVTDGNVIFADYMVGDDFFNRTFEHGAYFRSRLCFEVHSLMNAVPVKRRVVTGLMTGGGLSIISDGPFLPTVNTKVTVIAAITSRQAARIR